MTGWAKWEARQLPSSSDKIINWRNYWHIPDKTEKISATLTTYKMESKCPCPTANMKAILGMTLGGHLLTLVAMPTAVSTPEVVILLEQVKLPLAPGQGYSLSKYILPHHHMAGMYLLSHSRDRDLFLLSRRVQPKRASSCEFCGAPPWFTIGVVSCKLSLMRETHKTS